MENYSFGMKLSDLRKKNGMTQLDLARAPGVSNQAVSKWEAARCCPDIQLLPDIADCFGITVDELLGHTSGEEAKAP